MLDTISGYLFCLIFGTIGLGAAAWLAVTGQVIHSIDDLFVVLLCLLMTTVCFGYLGWRVQIAVVAATTTKKKKK